MSALGAKQLSKLKYAMRLYSNGDSIRSASQKANVCHQMLAKYLKSYSENDVRTVQLLHDGRKPYLSESSLKSLKLFVLAMDFNGHPLSQNTVKEAIWKLKKMEPGCQDVASPSKPTVRKIERSLGVPICSLWKGCSINAF